MPHLQERLRTTLANRYVVERELGRGGMATVYLAQDLKHDRQVALKVLHPELAAALGSERFLREIQIAARLQHPHILPLYDSGQSRAATAPPLLYYVMPFVEGESLRDRLQREKPLPVDEAVGSRRDIAAARWTTPTATASCTATSSPRTCCCTRATRWSPTSASPRR